MAGPLAHTTAHHMSWDSRPIATSRWHANPPVYVLVILAAIAGSEKRLPSWSATFQLQSTRLHLLLCWCAFETFSCLRRNSRPSYGIIWVTPGLSWPVSIWNKFKRTCSTSSKNVQDWASHLVHLQSVLQEFGPKGTPKETDRFDTSRKPFRARSPDQGVRELGPTNPRPRPRLSSGPLPCRKKLISSVFLVTAYDPVNGICAVACSMESARWNQFDRLRLMEFAHQDPDSLD